MVGELSIGGFGDLRRCESGAFIMERVLATGSLVVKRLGADRAGEMRVHRFLDAPEVSAGEIVETVAARSAAACRDRRVLAIQDTTEVNFAGRGAGRRGLGPAGDGVSPGFFIHPVIAVDAESGALLGLLDAQIWTRPVEAAAARRERRLEDKESWRWVEGSRRAAARLDGGAAGVVMVADREADVYGQFARRPAGMDVIVRAAQDRTLAGGGWLFAAAADWPELGGLTAEVTPRRPDGKGRSARVVVRAGRVTLARPRRGVERTDPAQLELTLVELREVLPPAGVEPLLWRLLTSLPVSDLEAALEVMRLYRLRWRIEETFRALKSDGLDLEATQIEAAARLIKIAAIAVAAAVRTIQLVDARDGGSRPATDILDDQLLDAAEAIGRSREGKTDRQKNPHPPRSLAWIAWIVARLGGWNCYYKPPGPKTMRLGWNMLAAMAAGYSLASHGQVP